MLIKVNLKKKCIVALLTDFSAETVEGHKAIEELNKSHQMTLEFCAKMHHSAKVFDKYIMKGILFEIQPMLYIPSGEIEEAQMRWQSSWRKRLMALRKCTKRTQH
jgi:hypothetical protein